MREVIERAAGRFEWKGHKGAAGMACNLEKDAHMAWFAEVEVKGAKVRVARMTIAFDCGAVLNPDYLKNQITGALIMGMGGALFEELRYDRFKIVNASLSEYRVPRFSDVPALDVIPVDRRAVTPAGAGLRGVLVPCNPQAGVTPGHFRMWATFRTGGDVRAMRVVAFCIYNLIR